MVAAKQQRVRTILVVDDMAIMREPIAASLRNAGYRTLCAGNGREALALAVKDLPDLILLDLNMPVMDGFGFLQAAREHAHLARVPVVVLTADGEKEQVLRAARLGARGYVLKSPCSLAELMARIEKQIGTPSASMPGPAEPNPPSGVEEQIDSQEIPVLMSKETCLRRAERSMQGKTLSGVVAQVLAEAASPRSDASNLARLIAQDPLLAARILKVANSAAYRSAGGTSSTISEAVRKIGSSTVGNIAATMAIFDALPGPNSDGFNPIGCWQHSMAVAMLAERLVSIASPESAGLAYTVGLCHDLGEILLHTRFADELRRVREAQARSGKPMHEVERRMLGVTRHDLIIVMLRALRLPDDVRRPIVAFHNGDGTQRSDPSLARLLRLADASANGLLLAASPHSLVQSFTRGECREITGDEDPPRPDPQQQRGLVLTLTAALARFSPSEEQALAKPMWEKKDVKIWLARDPAFSSYDPLASALEQLADVVIREDLPSSVSEFDGYQALVIASAGSADAPFADPRHLSSAIGAAPVLWMGSAPPGDLDHPITSARWPVPLHTLAQFVEKL